MGDYIRLTRLGAGHFGEVWLCQHKALGVKHAVKFVSEAKVHNPTDFFREPQLLKKLEHPNIVKVEDAGRTDNNELFIAMEFLPAGSVEDRYRGRPLPLRRLRRLCARL